MSVEFEINSLKDKFKQSKYLSVCGWIVHWSRQALPLLAFCQVDRQAITSLSSQNMEGSYIIIVFTS